MTQDQSGAAPAESQPLLPAPLYTGRPFTLGHEARMRAQFDHVAALLGSGLLPEDARVQVGYGHVELEGIWVEAVVLRDGALYLFRYAETNGPPQSSLAPMDALQGQFRPYILLERPAAQRTPQAWFDAREYQYALVQEDGHLLLHARRDVSFVLRPVPRDGRADFTRQLRLFDPQTEAFFRENPEAFREWLVAQSSPWWKRLLRGRWALTFLLLMTAAFVWATFGPLSP